MIRRILVHGRVQGVWFRGWTVDVARALGLDGWVRNRRDGSVEILASGDGARDRGFDRALPARPAGGAGRAGGGAGRRRGAAARIRAAADALGAVSAGKVDKVDA